MLAGAAAADGDDAAPDSARARRGRRGAARAQGAGGGPLRLGHHDDAQHDRRRE